ncbi:MAG TPA: alcohol dehydrogenase catalytic domain-containing protein, partial [Woeseiaceae bacterium]|nr:alcohol dehydrogenase catalytic domain-containing protein [Woeseiaceae bacterium]
MKTTRRGVIAGGLALAATAPVAGRAESPPNPSQDAEHRCFELGAQQGIESIRQVSRTGWAPGPGQVLVHPRAMALNHRDLLIARGDYGRRKPEMRVPVSDGAGEVVAVGNAVTNVQVGDRVTAPH